MNKLKPEVKIFSRFKPANQQIIQEDLRIWPNSLVFRSYRRTWNFFLLGNQIYRKHKFIWLNKKNINHLNIQDLNYGPEAWFLNSLAQSVNWFLGNLIVCRWPHRPAAPGSDVIASSPVVVAAKRASRSSWTNLPTRPCFSPLFLFLPAVPVHLAVVKD